MYPDGGGLYLQVAKDGSRSWIFRYRFGLIRRHLGLGALHTVGLAQARELAAAARRQLQAGEDPITARREKVAAARAAAAKTVTFDEAAAVYITAHEADWKTGKHADQWRNSLAAYASPVIGDLPVQTIDVAHVMRVLQPIWSTHTETASRVRSRIETVLEAARAAGHRSGPNPAAWSGNLQHLLAKRSKVAKVEHFASMPHAQVAGFLAQLRAVNTTVARALEFSILCSSRSGEVFGADWSEIDIATKVWTIPASRMKGARPHRVPLSDAALAVLGTPGAGLLFPGTRPGRPIAKNAFVKLLRQLGHATITAHGFRSSFRDWCADSGVNGEVAEAALAHAVRDKTEADYRRGDLLARRAPVMEAWAAYCGDDAADNVRALRRA